MQPRLKGAVWERVGDELRVVYDRRDQLLIEDPDGTVERLLGLLSAGGRTFAELADELGVAQDDLTEAVRLLDEHRLVEDDLDLGHLTDRLRERYASNLSFFESFATLACSREELQRRLTGSHALILGTGGLNSNTIPHLCGLGVGRLTLLDRDVVELRNSARQYLYRERDLGERKVHVAASWVQAFDPTIDVTAVDAEVDSAETVGELLDQYSPNVVMSGVDSPRDVDNWVNAACVAARTPYVRAGMWVTQGILWSVDPGRSACLQCVSHTADAWAAEDDPELALEMSAEQLLARRPRSNRGIGPVVGMLGALAAFEVLRYLTRFESPAYSGRPLMIDFANGCTTTQAEWRRFSGCITCGLAAPISEGSVPFR